MLMVFQKCVFSKGDARPISPMQQPTSNGFDEVIEVEQNNTHSEKVRNQKLVESSDDQLNETIIICCSANLSDPDVRTKLLRADFWRKESLKCVGDSKEEDQKLDERKGEIVEWDGPLHCRVCWRLIKEGDKVRKMCASKKPHIIHIDCDSAVIRRCFICKQIRSKESKGTEHQFRELNTVLQPLELQTPRALKDQRATCSCIMDWKEMF